MSLDDEPLETSTGNEFNAVCHRRAAKLPVSAFGFASKIGLCWVANRRFADTPSGVTLVNQIDRMDHRIAECHTDS